MTDSDQKKPVIAKSAKVASARKPVPLKSPALSAKAPPAVAKPVAPEPVAPKAAAVEIAAPESAPIKNDPAPIAPRVEAAVAVVTEPPVSKPVEAPVSSFTAAKASTIPPTPQFKVPFMSTQSFKGYEDFAAFGKANLEAFVQANTLFAKGIESLSKEVVSLTQSSLESSTAATKAIFAAKTLKDVIELQADFAKTAFEKMVANSTKLGEMSVKLATDSAAPIGARVTAASEKVMKPAA
jgi:phasin family protein